MCAQVQSCPTLYHPIDCSLPGSSVHEILQATILKWVAISFARGSSRSRNRTQVSCVSCIAGRFFTNCATPSSTEILCSQVITEMMQGMKHNFHISPLLTHMSYWMSFTKYKFKYKIIKTFQTEQPSTNPSTEPLSVEAQVTLQVMCPRSQPWWPSKTSTKVPEQDWCIKLPKQTIFKHFLQ